MQNNFYKISIVIWFTYFSFLSLLQATNWNYVSVEETDGQITYGKTWSVV